MAHPLVVNIHSGKPFDVQIDRATEWGNHFKIVPRCRTRDEAVDDHRLWAFAPEQAAWRNKVRAELRGKILGCWCAPRRCHGDTLAEIANG